MSVMYNIETQKMDISMIRGDTFSFNVRFDNAVDSITAVYFTVRKKATDEEILFQKSLTDGVTAITANEVYNVRIAPEDTEELKAGSYDYDLEVQFGEDTYTPLIGKLKVEQDVTYE